MIFKELDSFESQNADTLAIHRAQEQMTYYLRRAFGTSEDVDALSGLRLSSGGIDAQVDHLVLHPYGMVIVDCQSVMGGLQVRYDGQWLHWPGVCRSKSVWWQCRTRARLSGRPAGHCRSFATPIRCPTGCESMWKSVLAGWPGPAC